MHLLKVNHKMFQWTWVNNQLKSVSSSLGAPSLTTQAEWVCDLGFLPKELSLKITPVEIPYKRKKNLSVLVYIGGNFQTFVKNACLWGHYSGQLWLSAPELQFLVSQINAICLNLCVNVFVGSIFFLYHNSGTYIFWESSKRSQENKFSFFFSSLLEAWCSTVALTATLASPPVKLPRRLGGSFYIDGGQDRF